MAAARPSGVHTAAELGASFGKDSTWVEARTGIACLQRLTPEETAEHLALEAGRRALERAALPDQVDLVITASCSGIADHGRPIASRLAPFAAWFEVNSACSGFCYALGAADSLIRTGTARAVLVVAVEQMSRLLNPDDLGTSIIFGDGAGAAVITASKSTEIGPLVCGSDGSHADLIANDPQGHLRMQGRSVFRWAVETVPTLAEAACRRAGVTIADIEFFVPHQANLRSTEAVARRLGLDHAVIATDITTAGNTSATSIPIALDSLLENDPRLHGRLALLVGFGARLSYAAQVVRLP